MVWEFDSNKPIYLQIVNEIKIKIISGQIATGSKLESVRDLSQQAGVNPNTMQRALMELEKEGLVYSQRTTGRYVTVDTELLRQIREQYAKEKIQEVIDSLSKLGYKSSELLQMIENYLEELK